MLRDTLDLRFPIRITSRHFAEHKYAYYDWLRENEPVFRTRLTVVDVHLLTRYEDCVALLRDERFVRNRATATGGRRTPIPLPRSVAALASSMITTDDPDHKRLRGLVQQGFTPGALRRLEGRIDALCGQLLDEISADVRREPARPIDLLQRYALPIPVTVIREMVGVSEDEMQWFRHGIRHLGRGFSPLVMLRSMLFDIPKATRHLRQLIERKRRRPRNDILTALIHAEEDGERLSEDELVSMVWLLVIAGFETTVHLITNSMVTLLQHPKALEQLQQSPELTGSAIEEVLRYRGPVHGTKPNWATEEVVWHGVTIPKGGAVTPVLGAANHDPDAFDDPENFDITRSPNRHLGFGYGPHFCLGAALARMETRVALQRLLERFPTLRFADDGPPRVVRMPLWHRHESLQLRVA